ncbi:MAG: peroxiredoxin [Phycisphaeraceae bacterium]|nr:peroxiredoxin [Phycisphaeraceae bacterium]
MENAATSRSAAIGKPAPAFTLVNQDNQPISLAGMHGKWVVLYFYPKNDTPGCTCEATEFTSLLTQFRAMDAVILGVSPDSPSSGRYFRDKYHLELILLSDPQRQVMLQYGAWADSPITGGQVVRMTYLIDPTGLVAWHWPEVIPTGHADRVREKLMELAHPKP